MREIADMLGAWSTFYIMMGSSAAALTGLVFVVITLIGDRQRPRGTETALSTFTTPTVFHFGSALFTSALMSAPFRSLVPIAVVLGLVGAGGAFYVVRIAIQASRLTLYRPDAEDWTWNACLPFVAYLTLLIGALALRASTAQALYAPAAAVTLLIFVGIHNAWDVVTFIATGRADEPPATEPGR